ncbi:MAG: hypothetical protein LBC59_00935 [Chitinispirillales bacterium]|nr:hypothetical protein [Chitinispirillales bacterium]
MEERHAKTEAAIQELSAENRLLAAEVRKTSAAVRDLTQNMDGVHKAHRQPQRLVHFRGALRIPRNLQMVCGIELRGVGEEIKQAGQTLHRISVSELDV